ncbi:hypothetical protein FIBSPDRAFT_886441 [Athelia psychrophila]|uniref:Uncharacterized protein n=1 Tax=Athelia psychrophila TaxID=1759441 RepID=A0A166QUA1_9AGAM|nr:hypothetical protein FIBSPDRAFT_886441 [Fibularhizoctonia sp. CBS 109695]
MDQPSYLISVLSVFAAVSVLILTLALRFLFPLMQSNVPATRTVHIHRGIRSTKSTPNLRLLMASGVDSGPKVAPLPRSSNTCNISQGHFPLMSGTSSSVTPFAASTKAFVFDSCKGPAQSPVVTPINSYSNSYREILRISRLEQSQTPKVDMRCLALGTSELSILDSKLSALQHIFRVLPRRPGVFLLLLGTLSPTVASMERNRIPYSPCSRTAQLSSTPRSTSSNTTVTPARKANRVYIGTSRKAKPASRKASFSYDLSKQPSDAPNEREILDSSRRPSISIVAFAADTVTANVSNIVGAMRSGRKSIAKTPSSVASFAVDSKINQPKSSMRAGRNSIMATSSSVALCMSKIKAPMRSSSRGSCSKATPSAALRCTRRPPLAHSQSSPATTNSPEQLLPFIDGITGTVFTDPFEGVYGPPQPSLRRSATALAIAARESMWGQCHSLSYGVPSIPDTTTPPSKLHACQTLVQEHLSVPSGPEEVPSEYDSDIESESEA